ncbi:MAG: UDP-N-acetylmuramoyl-tripeptide--D-alanyl-D-alanine ligase [Acidobacteriota bacterium]
MRAQPLAAGQNEVHLKRPFPKVSTDTRRMAAGQAFFALQGARDGHEFLPEAVARGASVVVVAKVPDPTPDGVLILQVDDTLAALQRLAAAVRQSWPGRLVAVTGSMGKTTTRSFIAHFLRARFTVHETAGNYNNHIGVPLTLLDLEPDHEVAVLELGMNHAGEIDRLASLAAPHEGVLTNVAPVHLAFFPSLEAIAEAKGELIPHLPAEGTLFFNADDLYVSRLAQRYAGRRFGFGTGPEAQVRIRSWEIRGPDRTWIALETPAGEVSAEIPLVGAHFVTNVAAAAAVAVHHGIPLAELREALPTVRPVGGRGVLEKLGAVWLWDDSYNSSPAALAQVLQTVGRIPGTGRRVLVLGDMLELGPQSVEFHRRAGAEAAEVADLLIAVGSEARYFLEGARNAGMANERLLHCVDCREAAKQVPNLLEPGDLAVVKGSRGVRLDEVVKAIKEAWA